MTTQLCIISSACPEPTFEAPLTFEAIYNEYFSFVWRSVCRLGVPASQTDDAVQDVFIVVHRKRCDFEGRSSFKTWLFAIVLRVTRDYRRKSRRKDPQRRTGTESDTAEVLMVTEGCTPHETAEQADARRLLHELIDTLDDDKREVFILSELEELSVPEIATLLSINVNTAYSRLRFARQEFDKAVARYQACSTGSLL